MILSALTPNEERILVFAPFGSDGTIARRVLGRLGIHAASCDTMKSLCAEVEQGVGAILITEEALRDPELHRLMDLLDGQPSWSSIPVVVAANIDMNLAGWEKILRRLEQYKVTFLSRPVVIVSLATTLRSALAARKRQYQVRDLMVNLQTELRLRDEFLATLSHELRNPLGALRNAVQLLGMAEIEDQRLADSRDIIDRQSRDLSRLLDDLLDVARVTQGKISLKPVEFCLRELLLEIVRDQQETGGMHCDVELRLPEDQLPVRGDRLRIKQVFLNLLHNADKFSDGDDVITVRAWIAGDEVAVSIRDRGIGIPRDMLDSVFSLFSQADRSSRGQRGGLGIGLTVVQGLLKMHRGRVTVSSAGRGQGAEFIVYLPRLRKRVKEKQPELRSRPARGTKRKHILVIEDDPDGGASLQALLESDGHRVRIATDGRSGMLEARAMKPDAILLDIGLPDSSGYEIARLLRADPSFSETLLIALTGFGSVSDRRRALDAGFDQHLTKPIDFAALRRALQRGRAAEAETAIAKARNNG